MNLKHIKKKQEKIILELKYHYADLEYHEEVFKDAQEEFKEAFYEQAPKFGYNIEKPKPVETLSNTEISRTTPYQFEEKVEEQAESAKQQILEFEKEEQDPDIHNLFRKIIKLTHPDTFSENENAEQKNKKTQMFLKAKNAAQNKNWYELCQIALELNIEIPEPTKKHIKWLENEIVRIKERITHITATYAWYWFTSEDTRDNIMEQYVNRVKPK
jgi:hypothetical protein